MINVGLFLAYILLALCVLTSLVMPLIKVLATPRSLKNIGIGLGSMVFIFLFSFLISDGTPRGEVTVFASKAVGAGLITMYLLAFIAIVGIIYTEIKKSFR